MKGCYSTNTLRFVAERCSGCGLCWSVCPHAVFSPDKGKARLVRPRACMECGACRLNCPSGAIQVDSGVGCAAALMWAALTGKGDESSCSCCD